MCRTSVRSFTLFAAVLIRAGRPRRAPPCGTPRTGPAHAVPDPSAAAESAGIFQAETRNSLPCLTVWPDLRIPTSSRAECAITSLPTRIARGVEGSDAGFDTRPIARLGSRAGPPRHRQRLHAGAQTRFTRRNGRRGPWQSDRGRPRDPGNAPDEGVLEEPCIEE